MRAATDPIIKVQQAAGTPFALPIRLLEAKYAYSN